MTLLIHEIKRNYKALLIWAIATIFTMLICVLLFPAFKDQQEQLTEVFKNLGAFSKAFGMDQLKFGTIEGFYGMECGQVLAFGGGFFAALIGANSLSKEEGEHTSEFLLTHPKSRNYIITSKLMSVIVQIIIFNLLVIISMEASLLLIGEEIALSKFLLFHFVAIIMQIELAAIGFIISAFLRRSGTAIGIGIAFMLYFMSIVASISDKFTWLKYFTPYGLLDANNQLVRGTMEWGYLISATVITVVCIAISYIQYNRKDIY